MRTGWPFISLPAIVPASAPSLSKNLRLGLPTSPLVSETHFPVTGLQAIAIRRIAENEPSWVGRTLDSRTMLVPVSSRHRNVLSLHPLHDQSGRAP